MEEIKRNGYIPSPPDPRDYPAKTPLLASLFTPRSVDLRPKCSPVENQFQIGSCVANAITSAMEYYDRRKDAKHTDLSRLHLYYWAREKRNRHTIDEGCVIRDALTVAKGRGVISEDCWPYETEKFADLPSECPGTYRGKISEFRRIIPGNIIGMRHALAKGDPIVIGGYFNFDDPEITRTGNVPVPDQKQPGSFGHAMLIVGYIKDGLKTTFIVRNSWGTEWGYDGHCFIPGAYFNPIKGLVFDLWVIKPKE